MEKDDKGSTMIRMGVSGWMFLLVPAYPGCPGSKAVKRSLLLLLLTYCIRLLCWLLYVDWVFMWYSSYFMTGCSRRFFVFLLKGVIAVVSRDGWIMREKFANYAQRFYRLCAHFLPIMRKLCALFANYAQIMRNDFKDYARTFALFCQLCAPST